LIIKHDLRIIILRTWRLPKKNVSLAISKGDVVQGEILQDEKFILGAELLKSIRGLAS
jgi:hypothetical protein